MELQGGREVRGKGGKGKERERDPAVSAVPVTSSDDTRQKDLWPRSMTCLADRSYGKKGRNFRNLTSESPNSRLGIKFSMTGFVFWASEDKA